MISTKAKNRIKGIRKRILLNLRTGSQWVRPEAGLQYVFSRVLSPGMKIVVCCRILALKLISHRYNQRYAYILTKALNKLFYNETPTSLRQTK